MTRAKVCRTTKAAAVFGAVAGIAASNLAYAQLAQQNNAVAPASATGASSAAAGAPSPVVDNGQVGDIIVTAQRRSERLQSVPISVSAISGDAAVNKGITGTSALGQVVPSLEITTNGLNVSPFLRGIGSSVGVPNAENSVAIYVDGVYQPAAAGNLFDFNNIERVEVLKGPQSTLFGRNSTGGVIQVITKDPTQTPEIDASVGYANYNTVTANGYVAGGIAKDLAASVAVIYKNRGDGWGTDLPLDEKLPGASDFAIRGKLVFDNRNGTQVHLAGFYSHSVDDMGYLQIVPGAKNVLGQGFPGDYNSTSGFIQSSWRTSYGASLTIDHDFENFHVASITAYQNVASYLNVDTELVILPLVTGELSGNSKMISQEFHISSPSGSRLKWLAGVFLFDYKAAYDPVNVYGLAFGANPQDGITQYGSTLSKSAAVFAQATYPLTDTTDLTLGARYSEDSSVFNGEVYVRNTSIIALPINGVPAYNRFSYGKPTWRISLDHKFTPDILGYASYNRGYKSGNFSLGSNPTQADGLTPLAPYEPERLDAYELGLKSELFDRRLRMNLAAFYYDFGNFQFQKEFGTNVITLNGTTARSYGVEADLQGRVTSRLTLTANASYLHTRIGNFPGAPNTVRDPVTGISANGPADYNAEGNELPFAPPFTGSVGLSYRYPTEIGDFDLNGNAYHNSGSFAEIDNRLRINSYNLVNASLGWTDKTGGLSIRVWGKNLTKAYYYVQLAGRVDGPDGGEPNEPRTYGVTLRVKM